MDGLGLVLTSTGGLLIYAGIKGYSMLAILQNLVAGKPIATGVTLPLTNEQTSEPDITGGGSFNFPMPNANMPKGLTFNQQIGWNLANGYGWGSGENWSSLMKLWTRESGWNARAENKTSGAYGIPQALPYTKMPKTAWPERYGGASDPNAQIAWGLSYIKGRYGNPVAAWAHETQKGWY